MSLFNKILESAQATPPKSATLSRSDRNTISSMVEAIFSAEVAKLPVDYDRSQFKLQKSAKEPIELCIKTELFPDNDALHDEAIKFMKDEIKKWTSLVRVSGPLKLLKESMERLKAATDAFAKDAMLLDDVSTPNVLTLTAPSTAANGD